MFAKSKMAQPWKGRTAYDKKKSELYYDQDGTGLKDQVKIGTLNSKTDLKHTNFLVI